jgi:uncharacterized membrane protein
MSTYSSAASSQRANPTVRAAIESDRGALGQGENVGEVERWISGVVGAALVVHGLRQRSLGSLALAAFGGSLLYRGATGYCGLYDRLGMSTVGGRNPALKWAKGAHRGILVTRDVTVDRPVEQVFSFWRNFENFPSFMRHLESVKQTDPTHSHWVARGPMGTTIEWDAEIFNERPNEIIAWRSVEGSEIDCAGSVRFRKAPGDRGTEVHVSINYEPPGGELGASIAWLFGEEPRIQIEEDLARFKQVVEAGEITRTDNQPQGH